jgi:hypothetical protein
MDLSRYEVAPQTISKVIALRRQPSLDVILSGATAGHPGTLRRGLASHDPDLIAAVRETTLYELDRLDDDERDALADRGFESRVYENANTWMNDVFEVRERLRVVEHDPCQR